MASTPTKQTLVYCFAAAVVLAVLIATALAYMRSHTGRMAPVKSMDTWQQADAPLGYPLEDGTGAAFDPRFIQLTALERALVPVSPRMEQPMGSRRGALTYNAQPFWSDNKQRGGHHTGDDINGIGGMDTDLGDPVYAVANGLVIYRGEPSPGWGNTVILAYRADDGRIRQFMYAHLEESGVSPGELVSVGEKTGTVGTANLRYPAHLHLELRQSSGAWIGAGYVNRATGHADPLQEINRLQHSRPNLLYTAPLLLAKRERLQKAREELSVKALGK